MRNQLQKFTNFTNTLLPHETTYLLSVQKFKDEERLEILKRVDFNAQNIDQFTPYDTAINKRKYNHLQNWISDRLHSIDVDKLLNRMLDLEQKIMTDRITPDEEKELLRSIKSYKEPDFNFSKFFEIIERYRHFLLIRLRYADHQLVDDFLKNFRSDYLRAREINEKIHRATLDIVGQYSNQSADSKKWEEWLTEIFYDEKTEGRIRYLAMVRLVFISHNYREFEALKKHFDFEDEKFAKGEHYSRRILLNYYNNRLMLHSNFREYEKAVYYGKLAIRAKTQDHLHYVNNLCAVLLRLKKNQEALELMQGARIEAKNTKNFHDRIGFVAFHMEALNKNGLYRNSKSYGNSFLKAFSKEILQYRWHLFFKVFLESLMLLNEANVLLKIAKRYKLAERDKSYQKKTGYLPVIPIFIETAKLREGLIPLNDLMSLLEKYIAEAENIPEQKKELEKFLLSARKWLPEVDSFKKN